MTDDRLHSVWKDRPPDSLIHGSWSGVLFTPPPFPKRDYKFLGWGCRRLLFPIAREHLSRLFSSMTIYWKRQTARRRHPKFLRSYRSVHFCHPRISICRQMYTTYSISKLSFFSHARTLLPIRFLEEESPSFARQACLSASEPSFSSPFTYNGFPFLRQPTEILHSFS